MGKLISLLWHMHQPYYKDTSGEYVMPWVFLHAIKDYFDMLYLALKYNVKVTFNLVPSLIVQLEDYTNFDVNDRFLKFLKKKDRTEYEKSFILSIMRSIPVGLVTPRIKELLSQPYLNLDDMNDLEVSYLLAYCGGYLKEHSELVRGLMAKSSFEWEEKISLLEELHRFVGGILPAYKKAWQEDRIEISLSPFYHPILPLLIDMNAAGNLKKPNFYVSFKDDAKLQIERALELFLDRFGKKPLGMWPSEGSVSRETLDMIKEFDFKWVATDEDILHKTNPTLTLDKRYFYNGLAVVFRNKVLSDKIGFKYRFLSVADALADFKASLGDVNVIIMDGENAWEYYNNPWDFLNAFHRELSNNRTTTISEFVDLDELDSHELHDIASGSWIGADFSIWVGDDEKNRAWELLSKAKVLIDEQYNKEAHELLLIDEGSDWFWWYGNTNYTRHKRLYDYLFKSRLATIYRILNKSPDEIFTSLAAKEKLLNKPPVSYIKPNLDGKDTFFEYINAGEVAVKSSAIHQDSAISSVKYGYDENNNLFLAVALNRMKGYLLKVNGKEFKLKRGVYDDYAVDKIVELKLPLSRTVHMELFKDGEKIEEFSFEVKPIDDKIWYV